jgi:hypothetical protein
MTATFLLRWDVMNFLLSLAWNPDSPNISLLHSWDDSHDPPCWLRWEFNFLTLTKDPPDLSLGVARIIGKHILR